MTEYILRIISEEAVFGNYPDLFGKVSYKEPLKIVRYAVDPKYLATVTVGGNTFEIREPEQKGFIVQKVYKKLADEKDKVLREWGDYLSYYRKMGKSELYQWVLSNLPGYCHTGKETMRLLVCSPRPSVEYKGKIALYKTEKDYDEDRLTAMKPGRAFFYMFPELGHSDVIRLNDDYLNEYCKRELTLHVSDKAEDFKLAYAGEQSPLENIYTTYRRKSLANSCMRYSFERLPCHPAEAYASGEFQIVYTTDEDGLVASRCVVWVGGHNPSAGPIYGVSVQAIDMIESHLQSIDATIAQDESWLGARLKAIPHDSDGVFIGPYLDLEPRHLYHEGKHLVISYDGDIDGAVYQGLLSSGSVYRCCNCYSSVHEDDVYHSPEGMEYCDHCYSDLFVWDEYCEEYVDREDAITAYRKGYFSVHELQLSQWSIDRHFHLCDDGKYWYEDDVRYCEYDGEYVSPESDAYFESDWDGDMYPHKLLCTTVSGETVSKTELEEDQGIWQLNADGQWEQVQEELELDA